MEAGRVDQDQEACGVLLFTGLKPEQNYDRSTRGSRTKNEHKIKEGV